MTAQNLIQQVTDTLYAPFRYSGAGIPEGTQVSEPGWIYRDTNNGLLWYKKTGSAATGWKALGGVISLDTTTTGNVGTGEDTLQTYTLPAGMLKDDGDSIRFLLSGTFADNANQKRVKFKFGATVLDTGIITDINANWEFSGIIVRTSATTQKIQYTRIIYTGTLFYYIVPTTASETLSSNVTIEVTGTGVATDDIVKLIFQVELLPAP